MSTKSVIVAAGIVLTLAAIAIGAWVAIQLYAPEPSAEAPSGVGSNPFGFNVPAPTPNAPLGERTLRTRGGESIEVRDFAAGLTPTSFNNGTYYTLYGPEFTAEGFAFSIQFNEADSEFLLVLLAEPLKDARSAAEVYLGNTLALSNAELCRLNVRVVVGPNVNDQYAAYGNLGMSFCADAITLP